MTRRRHGARRRFNPSKLRLMTYMALSAGYRGLTFVGDADLTRPAGEPLLIEMSFLNAEIDLCEQILARNLKQIKPYEIFDPDPLDRPTTANPNQKRMPKVAEKPAKPGLLAAPIPLDNNRGVLMLVTDFAGVSPVAAAPDGLPRPDDHSVTCPRVLRSWRSAPAMRGSSNGRYDDRVPGGTRITLPDFGTTTILLCTTDIAFCQQIQEYVQTNPAEGHRAGDPPGRDPVQRGERGPRAAQGRRAWHPEQERPQAADHADAGIEIKQPDAEDLLAEADKFLKNARAARDSEDYPRAWSEARRVEPAAPPGDVRLLAAGHRGASGDGEFELQSQAAQAAAGRRPSHTHPLP